MDHLILFLDGTSKPNPGKAACGIVLLDKENNLVEKTGKYLGTGTNNIAEYCGLIFGLLKALGHNAGEITVYTDSLLLVKQIKGEYKVKDDTLKRLNLIAKEIASLFKFFEISHIPDTKNEAAHEAANSFLEDNLF